MRQMRKIVSTLLPSLVLASSVLAAEKPYPAIPGITVADQFPNGCVDCHINRPEAQMDVRISSRMMRWQERVDAKVLARIQAVAGGGSELSGQHPDLRPQSYEDIPRSCMRCHSRASNDGPAMGAMLHALHLTGGRENHFLTLFGGECTHCHKFDSEDGTWTIPSGPEK